MRYQGRLETVLRACNIHEVVVCPIHFVDKDHGNFPVVWNLNKGRDALAKSVSIAGWFADRCIDPSRAL